MSNLNGFVISKETKPGEKIPEQGKMNDSDITYSHHNRQKEACYYCQF